MAHGRGTLGWDLEELGIMTTLYRPVLIKSAEQAEALPIGTLAAPMYEDGPDFVYALVRREETYEPWCNSDGSHARGHGDLDGFVALVPIEAEEERKGIPMFPRPEDAPWPPGASPNLGFDGRWYYIDEEGYSTALRGDHPFHDLMVAWIDSLPRMTRYTTPWEEA